MATEARIWAAALSPTGRDSAVAAAGTVVAAAAGAWPHRLAQPSPLADTP